ncbi:MAG: helix-turn-helix transcriptional regulator, partial [Erysipelotrichaceae bacterium]
ELRKRKDLTQIDLCKILNMQQGSYSKYERNDRMPDYDMIKKISQFYNVTIDYLLDNKIKINDDIMMLNIELTPEEKKKLIEMTKILFPRIYKKDTY